MYRVSIPGLLMCLYAAATAAADYAPATVDMDLKQVSDHVYYVEGVAGIPTENQGFISNAGVIVTGQGVIVFDALGTPSLAELLVRKIRAVTDEPITHVIVSHYHADHVYGLQVFAERGATIWAAQGAQAYIDSRQAVERLEERRFSLDPWVNEQTRLVPPDRYLSAPETFALGGVTLKLTPVGGAHSDADLTAYVEPDRVLLSGDLIFEGRVPFLGDANSAQWLAVLDTMTDLGVTALIPGHGPAAADPDAAVALTRDYLAYLREVMGAAVENFQSFDAAYAEADWRRFAHLPAFEEANRRNAYQVFLALEAESLGQ